MNAPVLFERLPTTNGRHLGHVRLERATTLNSLSLEMIDLIQAKIDEWRDDDDIVALFFDAEGDKAFSAGGDIQALYHDMKANPGGPCTYCDAFLARVSTRLSTAAVPETDHRLGSWHRHGWRTRHLICVHLPNRHRDHACHA